MKNSSNAANRHLRWALTGNPTGDKEKDFKEFFNPDSLEVLTDCMLEPSLASAKPEDRFQFERTGYFCVDHKDSSDTELVFNRTVTLRDSWAKLEKEEMEKLEQSKS